MTPSPAWTRGVSRLTTTACLALSTGSCSSDPAEPTSSCVGGTWTVLEPMNERREYPAPVTLADGRLLAVSGHYLEDGPIKSAEVFDPATMRWTWTGSLHNPRGGGGGTLLDDGRVLVADGFGEPNHFPSETYQPSTGEWTIVGKMNDDRQNYTMTLLEDGSVLVTGGINWGTEETLATSEVYDPSSDSWTQTAPLDRPRFGHGAVRLADGRVLVIGGAAYPQTFEEAVSCLIYDPATGTWAAAASMQRTYAVTAIVALGNGTVLALGLVQAADPFHDPLIEGTAEIYDPALDDWRPAAPSLRPRLGHTLVTLSDGRVLAIGGTIANQEELATNELYDPQQDAWTEIEPMTGARHHHGAARLADGSVVVMGGSNGPTFLDSVELLTPCR